MKMFLGMTAALVLGAVLWQHLNQPAVVEKLPPEPALGAGVPLDTSTATINVLTPPSDSAPEGQVSITVLPPAPAPLAAKPAPALALLLPMVEQTYAQGGPAARQMAALGLEHAGQNPQARQAYTALRNATPENGPVTPAVLLLESSRLLTLPAPAVSPGTVPAASAASQTTFSGWLRQQMQHFVTLRPASPHMAETPADAWHAALGAVQHHIASNNPAEAALLLGQPPLADDTRLDVLRHLLAEYADLQDRLAAVRRATLPLITGGAE